MTNVESNAAEEKISGRLLARNVFLNFGGQIIGAVTALATIPYVIAGLGADRFGVLSLAWVVLGYFTLIDLGIGRATVKFVAEAIGGERMETIPTIVWTSVKIVLALGLFGSVLLALFTTTIVGLLKIPEGLIEETKTIFYLFSFSLIIMLMSATLSGVLEAYQRFDLVNYLRVPSNVLTFLIPSASVFFGFGLVTIVLALLLKNLVVMTGYLFVVKKIIPATAAEASSSFSFVRPLLVYGWWIALHNASVGVLLYLERFLVGVFQPVSAVTYYSAPYELITRATIVSSSMMPVLFPAFSSFGSYAGTEMQLLFIRASRYLALVMGLIILITTVFADEIITFWLGSNFQESIPVLRILGLGVLLSSFAWLAGTALQARGDARSVTLIHVFQVPLYVVMTWILINSMGLQGAALAWTLRMILSLALLLIACWKAGIIGNRFFTDRLTGVSVIVLLGMLLAGQFVKELLPQSDFVLGLFFVAFILGSATSLWFLGLEGDERRALKSFSMKWFNR